MKLYKDKDWLLEQYGVKKLSAEKIGILCKTGSSTISYWLKKHEIKTRSKAEANRQNWANIEYRKNQIKKRRETAKAPDQKARYRKMSMLVWDNPEKRKEVLSNRVYYKRTKKQKEEMSKILLGRIFSEEHIKNMSISQKKRMEIPREKKRMQEIRLIAINKRPTKPERVFNELTPEEVRYIGNRTWWRKLPNGKYKNPDFKVTGQNKVIEVHGDYWHRGEDPQELINQYKQIGLDCLVIWENEIYNNPQEVLNKTQLFIQQGHHVSI